MSQAQAIAAELAALAARLTPRGPKGRAVMVCPAAPGAGASTVTAALASASAATRGRPAWVIDLDFANNPQARAAALAGPVYDAGADFWRCEPDGAARLVLQRRAREPVFVTRFEHAQGAVRRVGFRSAPDYWARVRTACALALVDARRAGPEIFPIARDMDGVIIVAAEGRAGEHAAADRTAAVLEAAGARVLGVVVNRAREAGRAA